jgi:hypothetical protein
VHVLTHEDARCTSWSTGDRGLRFGAEAFVFELEDPTRADRHEILSTVRRLPGAPRRAARLGIHRRPLVPLVILRAAEARVDYVVPYEFVMRSPTLLLQTLFESDERFRLGTGSMLRGRLGLAPYGDVGRFLELATRWGDDVWVDPSRSRRSGLPRRAVINLRRFAREVAGLPPPDSHRFTTGIRAFPEDPLWADVHAFVRRLWGHVSPDE